MLEKNIVFSASFTAPCDLLDKKGPAPVWCGPEMLELLLSLFYCCGVCGCGAGAWSVCGAGCALF
jgi:hypothetical protein